MSFPASNNGPLGRSVAHNDVCKTPVTTTPESACGSVQVGADVPAEGAPADAPAEVPVAYTNTALLQQATLPDTTPPPVPSSSPVLIQQKVFFGA